jgi:hypothetical protein
VRQITITLSDELYTELESASTNVREHGFGPETWAQEAVESALADRRLPRVKPAAYGARIQATEPEDYPVRVSLEFL